MPSVRIDPAAPGKNQHIFAKLLSENCAVYTRNKEYMVEMEHPITKKKEEYKVTLTHSISRLTEDGKNFIVRTKKYLGVGSFGSVKEGTLITVTENLNSPLSIEEGAFVSKRIGSKRTQLNLLVVYCEQLLIQGARGVSALRLKALIKKIKAGKTKDLDVEKLTTNLISIAGSDFEQQIETDLQAKKYHCDIIASEESPSEKNTIHASITEESNGKFIKYSVKPPGEERAIDFVTNIEVSVDTLDNATLNSHKDAIIEIASENKHILNLKVMAHKEMEIINNVYPNLQIKLQEKGSISDEDYSAQLYLPFIPGKTMQKSLKEANVKSQVSMFQKYFHEMRKAHSKGIILFDIKSDNAMYNWKTKQLRLVDFGFAKKVSHQNKFCNYMVDNQNLIERMNDFFEKSNDSQIRPLIDFLISIKISPPSNNEEAKKLTADTLPNSKFLESLIHVLGIEELENSPLENLSLKDLYYLQSITNFFNNPSDSSNEPFTEEIKKHIFKFIGTINTNQINELLRNKLFSSLENFARQVGRSASTKDSKNQKINDFLSYIETIKSAQALDTDQCISEIQKHLEGILIEANKVQKNKMFGSYIINAVFKNFDDLILQDIDERVLSTAYERKAGELVTSVKSIFRDVKGQETKSEEKKESSPRPSLDID